MNPFLEIPLDRSTSFQVDGQWYTFTFHDLKHLLADIPTQRVPPTNRWILQEITRRQWDMRQYGRVIHCRPKAIQVGQRYEGEQE